MTDVCPADNGKSSWPELVGINGEVAAKIIASENPKVRVSIVEEGMLVSMEISCDRVRVWVDKNGIVKDIPEIR
ncbi:SERINE PROTEASE INHIBITOR POTATO INHIBITOR I-TYPE FAMILY PROTEIN [Salix viminalis]|uniref:SERINE PROTEASE INHIBITOR POTATO INHIBITOR I-TYPE FAMILY PROTEIN n=1 Tax=Salix viminalis TaxID=40686 RepID=A0A6N2LDE8_SALVM|nr:SERINE PROTEASE INHIBITOR POTATO INHIBITOR I-TYPE FAMILY PROTEIN [Salix viminalis]